MDLELRGKVALVTGGSRGIGKAIALELSREGCVVAIAARSPDPLRAAAEEISRQTSARVLPVQCDTGNDDSVRGMVRKAVSELGRLDILVNNAARPGGQARPPTLSEITESAVLEDINVKVMGYLRCAREVAPVMAQNGWGRIVNIGGLAARQTGATITSMRNVAVAAMTKNLADELGPSGITVNCVHPGTTRTEATAGVIARRAQAAGIAPETVERQMAEGNTVRKIIDAQEVAWVVAFLASPKSIALNGDVIAAGGGTPRAIHY